MLLGRCEELELQSNSKVYIGSTILVNYNIIMLYCTRGVYGKHVILCAV